MKRASLAFSASSKAPNRLRSAAVIACAALHIAWSDLAEVKSLAVSEEHRRQGLGEKQSILYGFLSADIRVIKRPGCMRDLGKRNRAKH